VEDRWNGESRTGDQHDRQPDWVIRSNEEGADGLVNKLSPGAPGKLTCSRAFS
jgi:hypothetical protein